MPSDLPGAVRDITPDVIWPGLRRWDIFEGPTRILPEVPLIGEVDLKNMVPDALKADRHLGQFEVHLVYDGIREMWLNAPETPFTIRCGFGIVIQPGQWHGGVQEALYPARYIAIRFRKSNTAALPGISPCQTAKIRQTLEQVKAPDFIYSPELGECLRRLLDEHRQRGPGMEAAARGFFLEFLAWLQRDLLRAAGAVTTGGGMISPKIKRSMEYVDNNIGTSFSINSMAEAADLSPSQFRRIFHEEMGLRPHDYLARRRVEMAKKMLLDTKQSVTDIAMELGFASGAHLALAFRRFVGTAPLQFRTQRGTKAQ